MGTVVIAVLAISALLDRESGLEVWLEWRENLKGSHARVVQLVRENEALQREIEMLEAEPEAIDRAIREELDLALPGEVVVHFTGAAVMGPAIDARDFRQEQRQRREQRQRAQEPLTEWSHEREQAPMSGSQGREMKTR